MSYVKIYNESDRKWSYANTTSKWTALKAIWSGTVEKANMLVDFCICLEDKIEELLENDQRSTVLPRTYSTLAYPFLPKERKEEYVRIKQKYKSKYNVDVHLYAISVNSQQLVEYNHIDSFWYVDNFKLVVKKI